MLVFDGDIVASLAAAQQVVPMFVELVRADARQVVIVSGVVLVHEIAEEFPSVAEFAANPAVRVEELIALVKFESVIVVIVVIAAPVLFAFAFSYRLPSHFGNWFRLLITFFNP